MNTNFSISPEVLNEFRTLSQEFKPSKRFLQVKVDNTSESFVLVQNDADIEQITDSFSNDFLNIRKTIENPEKSCSYYIIWIGDYLERDSESGNLQNWLIVLFNGSKAHVKDRMVYAASLSILPGVLGNQYFIDTYRIADISEFDSLESFGYIPKSVRYLEAKKFMTEKEFDDSYENKQISSTVSSSNVGGLTLPFGSGVEDALNRFNSNESGLISLKIENENIELDLEEGNVKVNEIIPKLPVDAPRFVFYHYIHQFNGQDFNNYFFIYNCPGKCKVSQRMVYSSSKSVLLQKLFELGLNPEYKIEISYADDLTEEYLNSYAHPHTETETFIKKIAGPGRGKRRIAE